jgi:hypothetical protein
MSLKCRQCFGFYLTYLHAKREQMELLSLLKIKNKKREQVDSLMSQFTQYIT